MKNLQSYFCNLKSLIHFALNPKPHILNPNMFLIVGLGNPGKEYTNTRHNIGFMVADNIASHYNFSKAKLKFRSEISEGHIDGHKILLIKPLTYMNLSGHCVLEAAKFAKIPMENIIVIHDDLDLATSKMRVKIGGGSGGHNGLKDIDARLGKEYKRIRIGIGHPGDKNMVSDYVLHKFGKDERLIIDKVIAEIANNIGIIIDGRNDLFMTKVAEATRHVI